MNTVPFSLMPTNFLTRSLLEYMRTSKNLLISKSFIMFKRQCKIYKSISSSISKQFISIILYFCLVYISLSYWKLTQFYGPQVRVVKIKPMLRSTSPQLLVDAHLLHHLRPPLCQLDPCQAARWLLSLPGSRCLPCSRCSRNRTASHQSRSLRAWTQLGSCKSESTGIYLNYPFNTGVIQKYLLHMVSWTSHKLHICSVTLHITIYKKITGQYD